MSYLKVDTVSSLAMIEIVFSSVFTLSTLPLTKLTLAEATALVKTKAAAVRIEANFVVKSPKNYLKIRK